MSHHRGQDDDGALQLWWDALNNYSKERKDGKKEKVKYSNEQQMNFRRHVNIVGGSEGFSFCQQ